METVLMSAVLSYLLLVILYRDVCNNYYFLTNPLQSVVLQCTIRNRYYDFLPVGKLPWFRSKALVRAYF